jgi:hypothetical protein
VGQEVAVDGAHGHCVDHEPTTVVEFQDDELEQVAGAIGAEQQCAASLVVAIFERVAGESARSGVDDVVIRDACLRAERCSSTRLECNTKIGGLGDRV